MKDFFDKSKIISDIVKDNKWLVLIAFTGLSSMATNIGQHLASLTMEADNQKAIHEVATGFQTMMAETEPKVVKSTCSDCSTFINTHIRKEH